MVTLISISYVFKVFIGGAVVFIDKRGAIIFINKGSLAIKGRSFKTAKARVNKYNLIRWLIIYKLKGPLLLIYS